MEFFRFASAGTCPVVSCDWKSFYGKLTCLEVRLVFQTGPKKHVLVHVKRASSLSLGRSRLNDVAFVQDEAVSRRHLTISYHDRRYWVHDLGGTNGTFVNSARLPQHVDIPLNLGSIVEIGSSFFVVVPDFFLAAQEQAAQDLELALAAATPSESLGAQQV